MSDVEKAISKSLDEIDTLVANFKTSDLSKGLNDDDKEDVTPEDISEDAPAPDEDTGAGDNPDQVDDGGDAGAGTEDNGAGADADNADENDEDYGKSLGGALDGSDSVKKALEVSEFLRDLVKGLEGVLAAHDTKLAKSLEGSTKSQELLAKSFEGIVKSQKVILESQSELAKSIGQLAKRLTKVEEQPLVRKSVATNAKVQEKPFGTSAGVGGNSNQLSKSEALSKLSAAFDGGNRAVMADILALEGTGDMNALSPAGRQIVGLN